MKKLNRCQAKIGDFVKMSEMYLGDGLVKGCVYQVSDFDQIDETVLFDFVLDGQTYTKGETVLTTRYVLTTLDGRREVAWPEETESVRPIVSREYGREDRVVTTVEGVAS